MIVKISKGTHSFLVGIRLVITSLIFFYALLVLIDLPGVQNMLWNLQAREDASQVFLLALALGLIPSSLIFHKYQQAARLLSLTAALLFVWPIFQTPSADFSMQSWLSRSQPPVEIDTLEISNSPGSKSYLCFPNEFRQDAPFAIVLHGGGFNQGNASHSLELSKSLTAAGILALSLDYRLAPEHTYPAQLEDISFAIKQLRNLPSLVDYSLGKYIVIGESAGATIALNYGSYQAEPGLIGVVDLYGLTDLEFQSEATLESEADLQLMVDAYRGDSSARAISPLRQVYNYPVPVLSIHGDRDMIVPAIHAELLSRALSEAGKPNELVVLSGATHLFNHPMFGPSGQFTGWKIKQFILGL